MLAKRLALLASYGVFVAAQDAFCTDGGEPDEDGECSFVQTGDGTQVRSDCKVGEVFIENPVDKQPCQQVGSCVQCVTTEEYQYNLNLKELTGVELTSPGDKNDPHSSIQYQFPSDPAFVPGMVCRPGKRMPFYYFQPVLDELSNPADLTYQRVEWTDQQLLPYGTSVNRTINQRAIFNCESKHYCPNPWTSCECKRGSFCLNGFSAPGRCTAGASCDGGPSKGLGWLICVIWGVGIFLVVLGTLYGYRLINSGSDESINHLNKRKNAEDYINRLRVAAGFGMKTNVIETMRGLTERLDPCVISTLGLSMKLKSNGNYVLREVSAHFPPASLNAVMGPSGAGKTTFMNALAGRALYGDISGKIFIDGAPSQFGQPGAPKIGYVPQDDIMHDNYTVYQNLYYSAMLRLPKDMPKAQKLRIIDDVLLVLELDHLIDQRVGNADKRGISGGQKKRVNIAMELVAYPRVLFLDEPTTGLDSTACDKVCQCLKRLTSLGITVICVIHQPRYSVFRTFDNLLLLGKGGQTVYHGSTDGVSVAFGLPKAATTF